MTETTTPPRGAGFLIWLGTFAGVLYLLAAGRDLLIPFAVAVLVWCLLNALARLFAAYVPHGEKVPPTVRLLLAAGLVMAALAGAFGVLGGSLSGVTEAAPRYQENLFSLADGLASSFGGGKAGLSRFLESLDLGWIISGAAGLATTVAGNVGLIFIYVMFLVAEQKSFEPKLAALITDQKRRSELNAVLGAIQARILDYVWIKTVLGLGVAGATSAVLLAFGVDYAAFWAFIVFLLTFIPTVGGLAGVALPALMALVQFGALAPFLGVAALLSLVQFAFNIIEPRFLGGKLNLSTVVILLSLGLWGKVWGVAGMFLCVPITVIALIVFAHFPKTRPLAVLLSERGRVELAVPAGEAEEKA